MIETTFDYWAWFLILTTVAFGLWEGVAIFSKHRERTLTYWLRTRLGIEGHPQPMSLTSSLIFVVAMVGFNIWFIPHIVLGWWGGAP